MRIDKHVVASLCRLGNNIISMSLVSISFSCMDISSFGCIFHSVLRTEEAMAAFSNSLLSMMGLVNLSQTVQWEFELNTINIKVAHE